MQFCDQYQVLYGSVLYIVHLKLILHCMLTNWKLNTDFKVSFIYFEREREQAYTCDQTQVGKGQRGRA